MNLRTVRRVVAKELKETLRDRRTLMVMIVVPVFLYPFLLLVIQQLTLFGQRQLEEAPVVVATQGAGFEILTALRGDSTVEVRYDGGIDQSAVSSGEVDVALSFGQPAEADSSIQVDLLYDASRERSRLARDVVMDHLGSWEDSLLADRLAGEGLPAGFAQPVTVSEESVATPERMGGYTLGRFLPMILILMTLLGAFYPAIDLSAGEKERGTLEPLLTTPTPPGEIVAGKFVTVTLIAVIAATLNLVSMLLTFQLAAFQFGNALDVSFSLPWTTILLVILFLIPLAVFFSALFLGVALRAQSFKEAQNALTPVQLASTIPMMLPLIPGIPLSYAVALVPIGGVALLFRELMTGEVPLGPGALALFSTIGYALLALRFATRSFGREDVLFGSASELRRGSLRARLQQWRAKGRRLPLPAESLAFVATIGLLFFYLAPVFQISFGQPGIMLSQVLLIGLPALAVMRIGGFGAREALALRVPSARQIASALLIILGGIPVAWLLGWAQSFIFEIPEEFLTAFEELIRAETSREIAWLLLLVALTPAVCEELAFRGFLLQGLSNGMSMARSVALSAAIFGLFHLSFETAIRFLPSAWLGLVLGYVAWHTRSILATMLMHFTNNALIVLLVAYPAAEGWVSGEGGEPRWWLVVAGGVLLVAGVRLLPKRQEAG